MSTLADHLYRSYASPISYELKILNGILRAVRPPRSRRGKELLLVTPLTEAATSESEEKFLYCDEAGKAADIGSVILRHLVRN